MSELVTSAQMRAIEAAAIASGKVTGLELMERASAAVVAAVFEEWPQLAIGRHYATVLCGPGNNGGDGYCIARLLLERGWHVEVLFLGDPNTLPSDARTEYERLSARLLPSEMTDSSGAMIFETETELIVDAVFGTGLMRPLDDAVAEVLTGDLRLYREADLGTKCVAVDIPSGLDADTGVARVAPPRGTAFKAHLTVTFHAAKPGHYLGQGPDACGKLVVRPIGLSSWSEILPPEAAGATTSRIRLLQGPTIPLAKDAGAHKYAHGHALILAGGPGKGGAARLAARGALRIGAGLVSIACPLPALAENAARLDAIMLLALSDGYSLRGILQDTRLNALLLGPGLGQARAREMVPAALSVRRPTVLDADALTAFAEDPARLFALLHPACVLTPHGGEFAQLFPDIATRLAEPAGSGAAFSKIDATRAAAARAGCVVLFKGPDTVIAAPDGQCAIHAAVYDRAAPWLATAGAGDVLAGFIVGLLARGYSALQAAETAAWLHVDCARQFGPGLIAEDLPEQLPTVLRALLPQAAADTALAAPQPTSTPSI